MVVLFYKAEVMEEPGKVENPDKVEKPRKLLGSDEPSLNTYGIIISCTSPECFLKLHIALSYKVSTCIYFF